MNPSLKKLFVALSLLIFVCCSCSDSTAKKKKKKKKKSKEKSGWVRETIEGGGFKVSFPGKPEYQDISDDEGAKHAHMYTSEKDMLAVAAIYGDVPEKYATDSDQEVLNKLLEETNEEGGTITKQTRIHINKKIKGRYFEIKVEAEGVTVMTYGRMYLVGSQIHMFTVTQPEGKGLSKDKRDKFLNSYVLLPRNQ